MKFGVDVCVSQIEQLKLFRKGHIVAVYAKPAESDDAWFGRAMEENCLAIVTDDKRVQKWASKRNLIVFSKKQLEIFLE